jgi:hypothetical protein
MMANSAVANMAMMSMAQRHLIDSSLISGPNLNRTDHGGMSWRRRNQRKDKQ